MEIAKINNTKVHFHYEDNGHKEVLIFSNSLGCNLSMWSEQIAYLKNHVNLLTYDTRGHGKSEVTPGEYTTELLGKDVLALADRLHIEKFSFCGLSMGGLIGQWLGIHAGNRLNRLILANTAAKIGTETGWNDRIAFVKKNGMDSLAEGSKERWFTNEFRSSHPDIVQDLANQIIHIDVNGYMGNCAAVRDADFREDLNQIVSKTLIISGNKDEVTTVEHGKFLEKGIPNATHVQVRAAHLSNVEKAQEFSEQVLQFIQK
ncbi:3-oxoadipate enol-lactonase [Flagellimonas okinawensis]|uniref:3-oxoadipate enol-lactonase n=1 Tax=Flagellimonas okinawensis TaxID=3031324 RepID=A0ABT5XTM6_9FLAO|nr:3-oxoadipate enol-lactonase [[Muricauda] okinawensis]MDF0709224.1 3-oxoadipate enol-lactonase [[Muricauda] okinawensis]